MNQATKLPSDISSKILTIGPDYRNHRGGVGAVIDIYSLYFEIFNFIPSHKNGSEIYKSFIFLTGLIKLFYTLIINRKIKIIHIHGASYGSFYRKVIIFFIGKYIFRKKVIYHIHGGGFKEFYQKRGALTKRLANFLFGNADIVICLSQSWKEFYVQNFKIIRLIILPNIIDYPVKFKDEVRTDFVSFLFLGLICDAKGIFDLMEVIIKNRERFSGRIKLYIGGNGEVERLKNLIQKNHIEHIVEFLGWVTSSEKALILNSCDVYILPSYNEGLPISILEAMSYGKAIIATFVGGIPEIVENKENGLLIHPGDLSQIEQSVDLLLVNPALIKQYGAISAQKVERHLPHSVIKELTDIYLSVLKDE